MSWNDSVVELAKWFLGTFVLGLSGVIINNNIQETELELKRMEADTKLLEVVRQDIADNRTDSLEIRYLQFIQTFITTPEIKEEVEDRINNLAYSIRIQTDNLAKQITREQGEETTELLSEEQKGLFKQKQIEIEGLTTDHDQISIEKLKSEEQEIAGGVASIESNALITINNVQETIAQAAISDDNEVFVLVGKPITKWCKKGYYVQFNNTLRIGVKDLDSKSVYLNLKDIEIDMKNPAVINDNLKMTEGEVHTLTHNDYRYQITLNYIGGAGKNPFTKAAYISVSTFIKSAAN